MTNFEHMKETVLNIVSASDEEELRRLVNDTGISESGSNAVFSCSLCEKTYGRCNTFYDGDDCTKRYLDWCGEKYKSEFDFEDKAEIIVRLSELLKATRIGSDINKLTLNEDKKIVNIKYTNGSGRRVNIEGDSGYAIIKDVLAALQ